MLGDTSGKVWQILSFVLINPIEKERKENK